MILQSVPQHEVGKAIPNVILPLFWFEESINVTGAVLGKTQFSELWHHIYLNYRIVMIILICVSTGFGLYLFQTDKSIIFPLKGNSAVESLEKNSDGAKVIEDIINQVQN